MEKRANKTKKRNIALLLASVALLSFFVFIFVSARAEQEQWHKQQIKYANRAYDQTITYFYDHNYTVIYAS